MVLFYAILIICSFSPFSSKMFLSVGFGALLDFSADVLVVHSGLKVEIIELMQSGACLRASSATSNPIIRLGPF